MGDAWGCYLNLGPGNKEPDMSLPSTPAADMCDAPPICTGESVLTFQWCEE